MPNSRVIKFLRQFGRKVASVFFPTAMKKRSHRKLYDHIAIKSEGQYIPFMNHGYILSDQDKPLPPLSTQDEPWRLMIQLYHHVATQVDLEGREVLEVGCGHGGGSFYIKRYLKAKSVLGIDLSKSNIQYCCDRYSIDGLSFRNGDAEAIPFKNETFDVVVNVESSHCYPNLPLFFTEVKRVLRKGGYFLYADFRQSEHLEEMGTTLKECGLSILGSRDISASVSESIISSKHWREKILRELFECERLPPKLANWAALEGTPIYNGLQDGSYGYMSFLVQKAAN